MTQARHILHHRCQREQHVLWDHFNDLCDRKLMHLGQVFAEVLAARVALLTVVTHVITVTKVGGANVAPAGAFMSVGSGAVLARKAPLEPE